MADPRPSGRVAWTAEQVEAIGARGRHLLVSAAAGAGKTAVLAERVVRRIADAEDPLDVDRLLVVTFTEAAAAEMRQRIARRLEEEAARRPGDGRLQRQLAMLGRAQIATMHSFCLGVIRRYFYRLNLDPGFAVLGEHEARLLQDEVLEEVFEARYAAGDPAFLDLVDRYGGPRGDEAVRETVRALHDLARSQPWPEAWLDGLVLPFEDESDPRVEAWFRTVTEEAAWTLERAAEALDQALGLALAPGGPAAYADALAAGVRDLRAVRAEVEGAGWDDIRDLLARAEAAFGRLPPVRRDHGADERLKKRVQQLRAAARDGVRRLVPVFGRSRAELLAELRGLAVPVRALAELTRAFGHAYAAAKLRRAVLDFADLEHYTLRLLLDPAAAPGELRPSEVARELRARYDEVMVDEYQDTNPVQDAIITLLSRDGADGAPNAFLVGDVKQSIYRFRLAEPELFLEKYRRFGGDGDGRGRRIDLSHNFRCRTPVVDAVNFLFRQLMAPAVAGLGYGPEAELRAGADYPPPPPGHPSPDAGGPGDAPVEVHLLERASAAPGEGETGVEGGSEEAGEGDLHGAEAGEAAEPDEAAEVSALEREAMLVARRIRELVEGDGPRPPLLIWDRDEGAYRRVRYRDIAVLMRATRHRAETFAAVLARLGIPVYAGSRTGYFGAVEIRIMLSLLQVIDNPRQDIPLAAVLRSPLVGLSDEELARVRLACRDGDFYDAVTAAAAGDDGPAPALRAFLERLERWRTAARRGPVSRLIGQIYAETRFLSYAGAMPGGPQRQANLLALQERAREFDHFRRQGLFRFLRFLDRLRERDEDLGTAPVVGEREDVVRIMSIHGSKGLEFPVVFVVDLGRSLRAETGGGDLPFHRVLGVGPAVVDLDLGVKYPSLAHRAVTARLRRDDLAEELRVLYVALTRARERLILVGSARDLDRCLERWARAARLRGWTLPDAWVAGAGSYLDWLGPALARHAHGGALRPGSEPPADPEVAADPSRWTITIWGAAAAAGLRPPETAEAAAGIETGGPEPAAAPDDDARAARVLARLAWRYPYAPLVNRFAKRTVSELKGRFDPAALQEASPGELRLLIPERPRFVRTEAARLSAAERGTATHVALQHLDLAGELDEAGIRRQLETMVERELLTAEQAAAVDAAALAAFFASPLGHRLRARPEAVRREVAFTMALPAAEVYPDLPAEEAAGERVVVQGVLDCLVEEDEGLLLLDFKTDDPRGRSVVELAAGYRGQMDLYRRAVALLYRRPVSETYLVFLRAGEAVPV